MRCLLLGRADAALAPTHPHGAERLCRWLHSASVNAVVGAKGNERSCVWCCVLILCAGHSEPGIVLDWAASRSWKLVWCAK